MTEKIIIAGSGGQGIMLLGKVLAVAAMREGKFVTLLPSYGAEVRGGTAHCMLVISEEEIGSPYVGKADTLIVMNQPSLERFIPRLKKRGLLIINSSLVDKGRLKKNIACAVAGPFTDIAINIGNIKVANMIALGAYLAQTKFISLKSAKVAIAEVAPKAKKNLVEINQRALEEGVNLK